MVKFTSLDKIARTATFDVDGSPVTRGIPGFYNGSIDDYLIALAKGLEIEFSEKEAKLIEDTAIAAGAELA